MMQCDEETPKCGACIKVGRPCLYSYGKASAIVMEDPKQLKKYGTSLVAPKVWPLDELSPRAATLDSISSGLRTMTEMPARVGHGIFQTLAPTCISGSRPSKKREANRKRALHAHLQQLLEDSKSIVRQPSSTETTLVYRYIHLLDSEKAGKQPLSILGTWIQSIPSRLGSDRMVDSAVAFFVDSYAAFENDSYSTRKSARVSKAKALRELQVIVLQNQAVPSYEMLLATKLHYAAEVCLSTLSLEIKADVQEALLGMETMYHVIHAFGLAELLKAGTVANVDDEHFWNLIDNTYIDDVSSMMMPYHPNSLKFCL